MKKTIITLTMASVISCASSIALAAALPDQANNPGQPAPMPNTQPMPDQEPTAQQLRQLSRQIAHLEQEVARLKHEQQTQQVQVVQAMPAHPAVHAVSQPENRATPFGTIVTTGPSVSMPNHYDGSTLRINDPSINRDYAFLQRSAAENKAFAAHGFQSRTFPNVTFSGNLEGQAQAGVRSNVYNGYSGGSFTEYNNALASGVNITNVELDTYVQVNPWINGLMTFTYNTTPTNNLTTTLNTSGLSVDKALIILGNLDRLPVYGSIGQTYVPFGRYSYGTLTEPLTKDLFRIKARALTIGYHPNKTTAPYAEAFAYNGSDNSSINSDIRLNHGGIDGGMQFALNRDLTADLGASIVNSVGDSQGMDSVVNTSTHTSDKVPGVDVHGKLSYRNFTLLGEYAQATKSFDDMTFNNKAAKPKAGTLEGDLGVTLWQHPVTFAVAGSETDQSLAISVPKYRIGTSAQVAVFKDTLIGVEYMYNKFYSDTDTATSPSGNAFNKGGHSNVVTGQVDVYF